MQINLMLNGVRISEDVAPDMLLIDFVRKHGCASVKRGCETSNCGLCTVFLDDKPVLSCSVLTARAGGPAGRSCRIRCLHRRSGRRAVRLLQPGLYHECSGAVPGKSIPLCRRNQRISFRQSLPLLRL